MRLNGWQRLFAVFSTVWTLCVGVVVWQVWPVETKNYHPWEEDFHTLAEEHSQSLAQFVRARYPWAYSDLSDAELEAAFNEKYPAGGQPSAVSYYGALAAECCQGVAGLSKGDPTNQNGATVSKTRVRTVPIVGRVAFPDSMSSQEVDRRASELTEMRARNDQKLRDAHKTQVVSALSWLIPLWLGPAVGIYALGWAVSWVRRGFQAST